MKGVQGIISAVSGAVPEAFAPTDIASLRAWLDGANPGVTANRWDDVSGNDHHFSVYQTSADMPTHDAGDNSMRFSSDDALTSATSLFTGMTSGEIIMRLKVDAGNQAIWYGGSNDDWYQIYTNKAYLGWGSSVRTGAITVTENRQVYHTLNVWSAPSDWSFLINGTLKYNRTSNTVSFPSSMILGRMSPSGYYFNGNIKSMCIFSEKLSNDDRALMATYMDSL